MADVYNRSGDLSPERAVSPCWVERQWCGEEDRKSWFLLCQNSWRLDWKIVSVLEMRFVPIYHSTAGKLSYSMTALPLLSNPWDWPLQLLSCCLSTHLHGGTQADTAWELWYSHSCFLSFICMPCLFLSLQAGLSQAFVLCLQAQNPGSVKDSSLRTKTSFKQENRGKQRSAPLAVGGHYLLSDWHVCTTLLKPQLSSRSGKHWCFGRWNSP